MGVGVRAWIWLAAWGLAACAGDPSQGIHAPWSGEREELGDTVVVRTVAGSVWGDTMVLVPELAIGEMEGEASYVFGQIRAVDVDPEGRILVLDGQAREIRVFSPEGSFLHGIGRVGEGPGEFRNPNHLRATSDGRVVVRDQAGGRYHIFTGSGEYLGGGWPDRPVLLGGLPFFLDDQDRVLDPQVPDPARWRLALVRYGLDGSALDTLAVPDPGFEPPVLEVRQEGGVARYTIPLTPSEVWTVDSRGRVLHGVSERYRFDRYDTDGSVLRIEREVDPVPVAPAEAERLREETSRRMRSMAAGSWRWDGPDIPSTRPAFSRLLAGADGSIWVFRHTPATEEPNPAWDPDEPDRGFPTRWRTPVVVDVFDEDGRFLGPVRVPDDVQLFAGPFVPPRATTSEVLAPVVHPLGHPQVVRFRLEPMGASRATTAPGG